jgi:hypothetical protein
MIIMMALVCPDTGLAREKDESARRPQIEALLQKTGIKGQLGDFHKIIMAAIPSDAFPNSRMRRRARQIVRDRVGAPELTPIFVEAFVEHHDPEFYDLTWDFYNSRHGSRVGRLVAESAQGNPGKLLPRARRIERKINPERRRILERIVGSQKMEQRNEELLVSLLKGLLEGAISDTGRNPKELWRKMEEVDTRVKESVKRSSKSSLAIFAYTFRTLDDRELYEFAAFEESQAGAWFGDVRHRAYMKASYMVGKALAAAIGPPEVEEDDQ